MPSIPDPVVLHRRGPTQRTRGLAACVVAVVMCANPANASRLTVPDDVATLQAAFDARVDTVLVRAGIHDEVPTASDGIVLLGIEGASGLQWPAISGLSYIADHADHRDLVIRNMTFSGQVRIANTGGTSIVFEGCHFGGGIIDFSSDPTTSVMTVLRCHIVGNASLNGGECVVDSCLIDGHLTLTHSDTYMFVRDCVFRGDGTGVALGSRPSGQVLSAEISRNVISGYGDGIQIGVDSRATIEDNVVRDCAGTGIYVLGDVSANRNRVERCGSYGIVALGSFVLDDNIVSRSGESGIVASGEGPIVGNVVYECGRYGVAVGAEGQAVEIRTNTLAKNHVSGISFYAGVPYVVHQFTGNVGYENGGYGLEWSASETFGIERPTVRFNSWFGNSLGDVRGLASSSEDFQLDPLFCDAAGGDFHLSATSPLADVAGYGRLGALGIGCAAPGVFQEVFRLSRVGPNPSSGHVNIDFEMPRAASIDVDVFDIQGRLVASPARGSWPPGKHSVSWQGTTVRPGLYLVRYRFPGGEERRRLVRTP